MSETTTFKDELKQFVIKKKYKKYFSEIGDDVKRKVNLDDFNIVLFLGGKNRGKSYTAFQMFYDELRKGHKVVYLRNSQVEIDKIKNEIGYQVGQIKSVEVRVNNNGIYNKLTGEQYVMFMTAKSYNNVSGNLNAYSFVFYDEYNQNLTIDMMQLMENFLLSMNTLFRSNAFKIVVCGNTKTQNNLFFNLYHINPKLYEHTATVTNWADYLLAVRYDDDIFEASIGDSRDMQMIKFANPQLYDQMFRGINYGFEDRLIINRVTWSNGEPQPKFFILIERIYQGHVKIINGVQYYGLFYIGNFEREIENAEVTTTNHKYHFLFNYPLFAETNEPLRILKLIGKERIFFNDFIIYNYFFENRFLQNISGGRDITSK